MTFGIVYKITDLTNGLIYVGKTCVTLKQRWSSHCRNSRRLDKPISCFHAAIQRAGEGNFLMEMLAEADSDDQLDRLERQWIADLNSTHKDVGYNRTIGGQGGPHTEEARSHMGRAWTETQRASASVALKGRKKSPEHAKKCIENLKLSDPNTFVKRESTRRKIWATEEFHIKMSSAQKKLWTEERRQQRSRDLKEFWKDPRARKVQSLRAIERWKSEEERQRLSTARKQWHAAHPEAGRQFGQRAKEWHSKVHLGAKRSEQARKNMRDAYTASRRLRMSLAGKGRVWSEESRAKARESAIKREAQKRMPIMA